ncbi:MAG TPA: ribosome maturation factor RimM [Rhizomicrobium sp.]|jgi:16S rRNA processing protein RimM
MTGDVLLGVVIGAQGLKGEVRVKTFTETPERIASYGPLRTVDGHVLEIAASRAAKTDTAVVRFKGIDDRTAAEALADARLFVPRSALSPAGEDEFYHSDLIGLRVQDSEGRMIGDIRAIHNFGAGDVIEIQRGEGGTLLLPFTKDFVPHINLAGRYVIVTEPEDTEAEEQRGVE